MHTEQRAQARPEKSLRPSSCPTSSAANVFTVREAPSDGPARIQSVIMAKAARDVGLALYEILAMADLMREAYVKRDLAGLRNQLLLLMSETENFASVLSSVIEPEKPDAGPMDTACETFDIVELLHEASRMARLVVGNKPVKIMDASSPCPLFIHADRARIRRIITGILNNAAKLTFRGRIALILGKDDDRLRLTVTDTGSGMTTEQINAFAAASDKAVDAKINGLATSDSGLMMARDLVALLKGSMAVSSKLGEGTIVEVSLPVGPPEKPLGRPAENNAAGTAELVLIGM